MLAIFAKMDHNDNPGKTRAPQGAYLWTRAQPLCFPIYAYPTFGSMDTNYIRMNFIHATHSLRPGVTP